MATPSAGRATCSRSRRRGLLCLIASTRSERRPRSTAGELGTTETRPPIQARASPAQVGLQPLHYGSKANRLDYPDRRGPASRADQSATANRQDRMSRSTRSSTTATRIVSVYVAIGQRMARSSSRRYAARVRRASTTRSSRRPGHRQHRSSTSRRTAPRGLWAEYFPVPRAATPCCFTTT